MTAESCRLCGGRGVIRAADVYTRWSDRKTFVDWELSRVVRCGCKLREAS